MHPATGIDPRSRTAHATSPAPKPKARPKHAPPQPLPEAAPDIVASSAGDASDAAQPQFPPVRVQSIRWHPLAARRVASLRFEQQDVRDAHEGDVVGGVTVYRIDPGAVELRIGSTSLVVRPIP